MVLLIDRDDDFRQALAANFADDGHRVRDFARPIDVPSFDALERLTMLVLDYQMDGEGGFLFADRFHDAHPNVPVVMMTTYWNAHLDAEAGVRSFMTVRRKPIDYEELARMLPPVEGQA